VGLPVPAGIPAYRIYRAMFTPVAEGAGNRCIAEKLRTGQLVKRIFWERCVFGRDAMHRNKWPEGKER